MAMSGGGVAGGVADKMHNAYQCIPINIILLQPINSIQIQVISPDNDSRLNVK